MKARNILFIAACLNIQAVEAATLDCSQALVVETYKLDQSSFRDARLASLVTRDTYRQIEKGGDGNAEIYGVPMGASYEEFQENIKNELNSYQTALTEKESVNVLWTGLSSKSVTAYQSCLDAISNRGLQLNVISATSSDLVLRLRYVAQGGDPNPLRVQWGHDESLEAEFPTSVEPGTRTIRIRRPKYASSVTVNGDGKSDDVLITPLRARQITQVPKPPAQFKTRAGDTPPACDTTGVGPMPQAVPRQDGNLTNLALLTSASIQVSSTIVGYPNRHRAEFLADGWYNNCRSWVAEKMPAWAQVDLGKSFLVQKVAFGNEFQPYYNDRRATSFLIQISSGPNNNWQTVYTSDPSEVIGSRMVFTFSPRRARRVRVFVNRTDQGAVKIDELEVWGIY